MQPHLRHRTIKKKNHVGREERRGRNEKEKEEKRQGDQENEEYWNLRFGKSGSEAEGTWEEGEREKESTQYNSSEKKGVGLVFL